MELTLKDMDLQRFVSSYEIDPKYNSLSKFDEYGNPTDWFDLKDVTTDEILQKHHIDSKKLSENSLRKLKRIFK